MKNLYVPVNNQIKGQALTPFDKSISQRALMLAAIADGTSCIDGMLSSDDVLAVMKALDALGVEFFVHANNIVEVVGRGLRAFKTPEKTLDLGNSGTGVRLLTGLLAGAGIKARLTGDASLCQRPMERICAPLRLMGAEISTQDGHLPLKLKGGALLNAIHYKMPLASAQLKSAILFAALYAKGTTTIEEKAASRSHSERLLAAFGHPIEQQGLKISVQPAKKLSATHIKIPRDLSSAAFLITGTLLAKDGKINLPSVGINPQRVGFLSAIEKMGAIIEKSNHRLYGYEPVCDLTISSRSLKAITLDETWVPITIDEYPLLFLLATQAKGTSYFSGLAELKVKESDRLTVMANLLTTMGASVQLGETSLTIKGGGLLNGGRFGAAGDHRIAMTLAVASFVSRTPIEIQDCQHIETSFPGFVEILQSLGVKIGRVT